MQRRVEEWNTVGFLFGRSVLGGRLIRALKNVWSEPDSLSKDWTRRSASGSATCREAVNQRACCEQLPSSCQSSRLHLHIEPAVSNLSEELQHPHVRPSMPFLGVKWESRKESGTEKLIALVRAQMNISIKTLAVTSSHFDGTLEYEAHNLYGLYQCKATADALRAIRQKRHFIFTRCVAFPCSRITLSNTCFACDLIDSSTQRSGRPLGSCELQPICLDASLKEQG